MSTIIVEFQNRFGPGFVILSHFSQLSPALGVKGGGGGQMGDGKHFMDCALFLCARHGKTTDNSVQNSGDYMDDPSDKIKQ